jgi:hypothetical protein
MKMSCGMYVASWLLVFTSTEGMMLMMAMEIERAVEHGYRVGYEDGSTGQSYSITARDEESLVLH